MRISIDSKKLYCKILKVFEARIESFVYHFYNKMWLSVDRKYFDELWQVLREFGFKCWQFLKSLFADVEYFVRFWELQPDPQQQQTCKGTRLSSFKSLFPFSSCFILMDSKIIFVWSFCPVKYPRWIEIGYL